MNKEFIPYEQAIELKELGFDIRPNFGGNTSLYSKNGYHTFYTNYGVMGSGLSDGYIYAPTFSQVFRWFREKYKLEGLVLPQNKGAVIDGEPIYFIAIISYENEKMTELFNSTNEETMLHYNPREDAELDCLKKLIEIVKNK